MDSLRTPSKTIVLIKREDFGNKTTESIKQQGITVSVFENRQGLTELQIGADLGWKPDLSTAYRLIHEKVSFALFQEKSR